MKHFLTTGPRLVIQRGVDSIYWATTVYSWASGVRSALGASPSIIPSGGTSDLGVQPHSQTTRALASLRLHPLDAPGPPPIAVTGRGLEILACNDVLLAILVTTAFATILCGLLCVKTAFVCRARAASLAGVASEVFDTPQNPFVPHVPATPTTTQPQPFITSQNPAPFQVDVCAGNVASSSIISSMRLPRRDWSLRHHKQRSAHVLEQQRIASIEHNPTVMIYPGQAPFLTRQGQEPCCTAQSADACITPQASGPTCLSLPDKSTTHTQQGRHQRSDDLSDLARLRALPLGSKYAEFDYKDLAWLSFLGAGGFGAVYKAIIRRTGQEVAMKCLGHSTRREYEQILDEVALVHRLGRNPWHATFYGAFCTWDRVFIATEFHSGGSLHDYIQKQGGFLHPRVARFYAAELLTAISHAHNLGIVHRDIKPQNILLNKDGHLLVIDPGVGVQLIDRDNGWTDGVCGTDGFMAPEVELGQCYDFRADYFSWGVTLYIMIVGRLPPRLMRHKAAGCFVEADGPSYYDLKHDTFLGHWERDLLTQVFSPELQNRPTLSQIMKHRYWAGLDWKKIDKKLMRPPMVREPSHPHLRHQLWARLKRVFCC